MHVSPPRHPCAGTSHTGALVTVLCLSCLFPPGSQHTVCPQLEDALAQLRGGPKFYLQAPKLLGWLLAEVLEAALGPKAEGKKTPKGAAGWKPEVTEPHPPPHPPPHPATSLGT